MSEEKEVKVIPAKEVSVYECGMCGRDGGPDKDCDLCHGNPRLKQTRSYTLSEERQGMNPEEGERRYGPMGEVSPRIVVLPGGHNPAQGLENPSNQEKN